MNGILEIHNQIMEIRSPTNMDIAFMKIHDSQLQIHQSIMEIHK